MTAADLLDRCRSLGVELSTDGERLTFRAPAGAVDAPLRAGLSAHKADLIALVAALCPSCHRPADGRGCCWTCHTRRCVACGRSTGSAFLVSCIGCDLSGRVTP
jgi:hypothetical protein